MKTMRSLGRLLWAAGCAVLAFAPAALGGGLRSGDAGVGDAGSGAGSDGGTRADAAVGDADSCVRVRGEVRYGALGYDHVVHLDNQCVRAFSCTITTNVNPTPIHAGVPPYRKVEVVTFRGSPARVFVPHVTCQPAY